MAARSLIIRRARWSSLGFHRAPVRLVPKMLLFAAVWSMVQLGGTLPIANHLSGKAHGFNNTIGFVAFFLTGPIYGLW